MAVKPLKAEVARRQWHFRYVPLAEVAMPAEEPSLHIDLGGDDRIDLARGGGLFQLFKGQFSGHFHTVRSR